MINWISAFANNLASAMAFPLIVGTVAGLLTIGYDFYTRDKTEFASGPNSDARWRTWAITHGLLVAWGVFLILWAVPSPDFIYRERVVEKVVEKKSLSTYNDAYDKCRDGLSNSDMTRQQRDLVCHNRALILIRPGLKVIERTTRVTVNIPDSYKTVYDDCIDQWSISQNDDQKLADGRTVDYNGMALIRNNSCHAQALAASDQARRAVMTK